MRYVVVAALLAFALPVQAQEKAPPQAKLFANAAEVDAALAKVRAEKKPGNNVVVLVSVGSYPAHWNTASPDRRPAPAFTRPRPSSSMSWRAAARSSRVAR
ncbi:MAG: hypothetical protein NTX21_08725 [Alphaproteobacteria bacterium]|nr:hypothetical protein [Alphaproteobacteria bacterium]